MKISSSRVFVADAYRAENYKKCGIGICDDVEFGSVDFDEELTLKEHIFIKFGSAYAPIEYCRNMVSYLSLLYSSKTYPDKRFIFEGGSSVSKEGDVFLKNVRPFYTTEQKLTLKELVKTQKEHDLEAFFCDIAEL